MLRKCQLVTALVRGRKTNGCTVGWPLLWAVWLEIDAQLKVEVQVRKLEELKLKKNIWFFTTLPSELADGMGEQGKLQS